MLDKLPGLMLFARVAQYGSLSAAAHHLGISRSAVSKQLAQFEAKMGAKLIQRTTRKLSLTELGEQILAEAIRVDAALNAVEALTDDFHQHVRGKLRVSCSTSLGRKVVLPLLTDFLAQHPDLEIVMGLEDRRVDLITEQIDIAIRIGYLPDSSLIARHLGDLTWQLAASPAYLARHGAPQCPADLSQHACLTYANMMSWSFVCGQEIERVMVRGPLSLNDANALVTAALDGVGIILIDRAMMVDALEQGHLVPLLPDYPPTKGLPVYAVYPARAYLPAKTAAFVDFLVKKVAPKLI